MVDIATFKRDARAMREGEWVSPGEEYGDLEIQCRALAYDYLDLQRAMIKRAAREAGGEDRIPSEVMARINTDCLIEKGLLGVRGLTEGGVPVSFARFCEMLRNPGYGELTNVAFIACSKVGRQKAAEAEDAVGNSPPPSVTN